jgi:hypothetical protein
MIALGLAAVPFFNSLCGKWSGISIKLPQTESGSLMYVDAKTGNEMPFGGGSGPDGETLPGSGIKEIKNVDLQGFSLRRADFESINITNSDFSEADLKGGNFSRAVVFYSSFIKSDLSQADFTNAIIEGSDLTEAKLNNAKFIRANMTHTDFSHASMINADLTDANLSDARLETSVGLSYEQLKRAVINEFTSLPPLLESKRAALIERSRQRAKELRKEMSEEELERYFSPFNFLD